MEHLKTYELFDIFKKKEQKPYIDYNVLNVLVEDCFTTLKDNGFVVKIKNERLTTSKVKVPFSVIIEKKDEYFSFKDIKHDIMQFHNMVSDYDVNVKFQMSHTFKWEDRRDNVSYKDILKGKYDTSSVNFFGIYLTINFLVD